MKSRAGALVAIVMLAGLFVLAGWMWMGHDYVVRFEARDMRLNAAVRTDQSNVTRLYVEFVNLTPRTTILVARSESLRGPFSVELYSAAQKRLLRRIDPETFPAAGKDVLMKLRPGTRQSWGVPLETMFGELSPGSYKLRLVYDPAAGRKRGEGWYRQMEVDSGRLEAAAVRFNIKKPEKETDGKKEAAAPAAAE